MKPSILKYLLDIESAINEITIKAENNFKKFDSDFTLVRSVDRELEIIGEAVNSLNKPDESTKISDIPNIISLRNLIIHSYDSVESELLWAIIQKDIPKLKQEIESIKRNG